jgi:small-conductance mechanosensitive channel
MSSEVPVSVVPDRIWAIAGSVTWEQVVLSAVIVLLGFVADRLSNRAIQRAVERRGGDVHAARTAEKFSAYLIYSVAFLLVLGALGVPLESIGAALGLIGLGLSFALRNLIENVISGMLILINKPFKIGDQVQVDGFEGTVEDIRMRASDVKTYDGRRLIVPNSVLYNNIVVNNTAYGRSRFEVVVGISFDSDVKRARQLAEEALQQSDAVEEDPEPTAMVKQLGESSVELRLWGWASSVNEEQLRAAGEVVEEVKQRFEEEGVEIPYPIRTVLPGDRGLGGGATD